MKTLKYLFVILILSVSLYSCTDKNDDEFIEIDPMEGLNKIYEFSEADHAIEIYSEKTGLEVGYNEMFIRIKDKASNAYLTSAALTWMPMMHMVADKHSAPRSVLNNSQVGSVYRGHIVFQMASNDTEYWELMLKYSMNGKAMEKTVRVDVDPASDGLKKLQVFTDIDESRYVLAFVNPTKPKVAINNMQAVLYKMEDMMNFPVAEDYKITVDPRMSGMDNHTSPNNQDLSYNEATKMYNGKLSLTMTGYWKINLKLLSEYGEVLKGEDVTETNPGSSLYFELEF